MSYADDKIQDGWVASAVGTNAGATATKAGASGVVYLVTGIQVSTDVAALVTVESPTGTVVWRKRLAAAGQFSEGFLPGTIRSVTGDSVSVKISASTSNCEANINGYSI